jgi:hypothetical protein
MSSQLHGENSTLEPLSSSWKLLSFPHLKKLVAEKEDLDQHYLDKKNKIMPHL